MHAWLWQRCCSFLVPGGGTSAEDNDVGYLSFGSSRAVGLSDIGTTPDLLTDLVLKGTRNGKTSTLGSWSTYAEATGKEIAVEIGTWTLELTAKDNNNYFSSTKKVSVKSGQSNTVAFTMSFMGYPAVSANTGDIILSNGYAIPVSKYASCSELIARYPVEAVALVSGGTVYGINITYHSSKDYTWAAANIPAGYFIPSFNQANVSGGIKGSVGSSFQTVSGFNLPTDYFWTTNSGGDNAHYTCGFEGGSGGAPDDSTLRYVVYFKQY